MLKRRYVHEHILIRELTDIFIKAFDRPTIESDDRVVLTDQWPILVEKQGTSIAHNGTRRKVHALQWVLAWECLEQMHEQAINKGPPRYSLQQLFTAAHMAEERLNAYLPEA